MDYVEGEPRYENRDAKGAHGFAGILSCGGQAEESCRINETIIAYWYFLSMITCKCFGCRGIARCLFE